MEINLFKNVQQEQVVYKNKSQKKTERKSSFFLFQHYIQREKYNPRN